MANNLEFESTYLLSTVPSFVKEQWQCETLIDIYIPPNRSNPQIRLRRRGDTYVMTKKYPVREDDLSKMIEETIKLSKEEYDYLVKHVPGKVLSKQRYSQEFEGYIIEIDQYNDALAPLVIMDIEWAESKLTVPNIIEFSIIKEITGTKELAAGKIAGKAFEDVKSHL